MVASDLAPLLEVDALSVRLGRDGHVVRAVDGVSFTLRSGGALALVGESGSGKTMLARSLIRLLPPAASCEVSGRVVFGGRDLTSLGKRELSDVRGKEIGFVFQDPMTSLNPVHTIGRQVAEPLRRHLGMSRRAARREAIDLLGRVGIPRPAERVRDFPHEFSGGMRQRVMIAMAMACRPKLLIADEPTTALDATIQAQILELIRGMTHEFGTAVLFITHNLGVAAVLSDDVMVMYAGQIVEYGTVDEIFYRPRMPYTTGLLAAVPRLNAEPGARLIPIDGAPPNLDSLERGCRFAPRCAFSREICSSSDPDLTSRAARHVARCFGTESGGWIAVADAIQTGGAA